VKLRNSFSSTIVRAGFSGIAGFFLFRARAFQ
jgi:hypothetical protein